MSVDYSSYGYAVDKRLALLLWISGQVRVQVVSKIQEGSGLTAQLQEGIFQSVGGSWAYVRLSVVSQHVAPKKCT